MQCTEDLLSEFSGGIQLRFLVVRPDGLKHLIEVVVKSGSADLQIIVRVEVVIDGSGLEVTTLGNGLLSLDS